MIFIYFASIRIYIQGGEVLGPEHLTRARRVHLSEHLPTCTPGDSSPPSPQVTVSVTGPDDAVMTSDCSGAWPHTVAHHAATFNRPWVLKYMFSVDLAAANLELLTPSTDDAKCFPLHLAAWYHGSHETLVGITFSKILLKNLL